MDQHRRQRIIEKVAQNLPGIRTEVIRATPKTPSPQRPTHRVGHSDDQTFYPNQVGYSAQRAYAKGSPVAYQIGMMPEYARALGRRLVGGSN